MDTVMTEQASETPRQAASVTCEHHFVSEHQPDMPVYWIRRCSLCGTYDAADLREQISAQVPEINEVQRLTVKPGDRLIIRTDAKLSAQTAAYLLERVRHRLDLPDDVRVVILDSGMSMEVVEGLV
jgi:hypothetical protein